MQNYLFDRLMEAGETAWAEAGGRAGAELAAAREKLPRLRHGIWPRRHASGGRARTVLSISTKDFFGKAKMVDTGVRFKCVTVLIDGPGDADPWGREALYDGDTRVGRLTSGGYSVAFGKSIGMGYVRPESAEPGTELQVKMQDRLWKAVVAEDSPYDPTNAVIRKDI